MSLRYLSLMLPQKETEKSKLDFTEIEPHLYLGNIKVSTNFHRLQSLNVSLLIGVYSRELSLIQLLPRYCKSYQIKANDMAHDDLISYFEHCYAMIADALAKEEGNVFVYCGAGYSRSATIVCAYLMKKYRITADEAIERVRERRNRINPNHGFVAQLKLFEDMDYCLDYTNNDYRIFILINLRMKMLTESYWKSEHSAKIALTFCEPIKLYLDKKSKCVDNNTDKESGESGNEFRCRHCKHIIFSDSNILNNTGSRDLDTECGLIYIEPIKWMVPFITQNKCGTINCFNCGFCLGLFNWKSFQCDCDSHNLMQESRVFQIIKDKIF